MSLSLAPRPQPAVGRLVRPARPVEEGQRIALPRGLALASAGLAGGAAAANLAVAGVAGLEAVGHFSMLLPLLLAASCAGVGWLALWLPSVWAEWRGPLGYATAAPWAGLMFLMLAAPEIRLPGWAALAAGGLVAVPFLWSAAAPGRLRARLHVAEDARGRRGALLAALALALLTWSALRPDLGVFVQVALAVLLGLGALSARGVADAGVTWGAARWVAMLWGLAVAWAAGPLAALDAGGTWGVQNMAVQAGLIVAAALPLALITRGRRVAG